MELWMRAISNVKVKLLNHAPVPSSEDLRHYRLAIKEYIDLNKAFADKAPRMDPMLARCEQNVVEQTEAEGPFRVPCPFLSGDGDDFESFKAEPTSLQPPSSSTACTGTKLQICSSDQIGASLGAINAASLGGFRPRGPGQGSDILPAAAAAAVAGSGARVRPRLQNPPQ